MSLVSLICRTALVGVVAGFTLGRAETANAPVGANLALVARSSTSYVSGHETITALNDGSTPQNSNDKSHGAYGNWPRNGTQWVEYEWSQPVSVAGMDVYWFDDGGGVRLPKACRLHYWDGKELAKVPSPTGMGMEANRFNRSSFQEITSSRLRLEFDSDGTYSTGLLEWRVYDSGKSPNFPPAVQAGVDRVVVLGGTTHLTGSVRDDGKLNQNVTLIWSQVAGPGKVRFGDTHKAVTTASFSQSGSYTLKLEGNDGQLAASDTLQVTVDPKPPADHLTAIEPRPYQLTSPFWKERVKKQIVNWIPHCISKMEDPKVEEGGIENFTEAGHKIEGRPNKGHKGAVFANAWVHNTVEAMCVALMYDPQGDPEITKAQKAIRTTLEDWVPKILSAQEPDGYLQTFYTLNKVPRWSHRSDHEGYLAGYFIESAIAHYLMTGKADARMFNAAKKIADCWCDNIGPAPKKAWYDGHQELEIALVRLARMVETVEGPGKGRKYIELARFLLESRQGGDEYDQSHLPLQKQYEAVGHAVRAIYFYTGIADMAIETGNVDYYSAARSLWDNIVNKKYYVTGGIGSGESSEGFGKDYSLPNHSYCESCSGCGELFFQYRMGMAYQHSRYADLYEETLYNAILGGLDLEGQNFTYTNPLDGDFARYKWHVCPCCVGNLPRTLLALPSWMYASSPDSVYVNLFIGSTTTLNQIAGTDVQMVQTTDYPWKGDVSLVVNPRQSKRFAVKVRIPNRNVSGLYSSTPEISGLESIKLNGKTVKPRIENGYAVFARTWKAGDRIDLVLPMKVQRVKASDKVAATSGRVALRYGPLIYNFESVDQDLSLVLDSRSALNPVWRSELLGGVMTIQGKSASGAPMTAIPNYARNNRGGRSLVWIKDR